MIARSEGEKSTTRSTESLTGKQFSCERNTHKQPQSEIEREKTNEREPRVENVWKERWICGGGAAPLVKRVDVQGVGARNCVKSSGG
jgi:hypothetical protein